MKKTQSYTCFTNEIEHVYPPKKSIWSNIALLLIVLAIAVIVAEAIGAVAFAFNALDVWVG